MVSLPFIHTPIEWEKKIQNMLRSWGVAWEITFESMKDHNVQYTKIELKILGVVIITESFYQK